MAGTGAGPGGAGPSGPVVSRSSSGSAHGVERRADLLLAVVVGEEPARGAGALERGDDGACHVAAGDAAGLGRAEVDPARRLLEGEARGAEDRPGQLGPAQVG